MEKKFNCYFDNQCNCVRVIISNSKLNFEEAYELMEKIKHCLFDFPFSERPKAKQEKEEK